MVKRTVYLDKHLLLLMTSNDIKANKLSNHIIQCTFAEEEKWKEILSIYLVNTGSAVSGSEFSQILYRLRSISNIFSLQHQLLVRLVAGVYYFIKSRINIRQ